MAVRLPPHFSYDVARLMAPGFVPAGLLTTAAGIGTCSARIAETAHGWQRRARARADCCGLKQPVRPCRLHKRPPRARADMDDHLGGREAAKPAASFEIAARRQPEQEARRIEVASARGIDQLLDGHGWYAYGPALMQDDRAFLAARDRGDLAFGAESRRRLRRNWSPDRATAAPARWRKRYRRGRE